MPLTPELQKQYDISARPFLETQGPVLGSVLHLRSWRYLIELNTACNLRCALCVMGNREGYERPAGNQIMSQALLEKVLDKIQSENPNAILCPYGNSEPFLHPYYPEAIRSIKTRGFRCEVATNLNHLTRLDEMIHAGPDLIIVSVSGFTQETYQKSHRGGNLDAVKENLFKLANARNTINPKVHIAVSYHMYRDNLHEMDDMKKLVESLGFQLLISWARVISIENGIASLRREDQAKGIAVPDMPMELPASKPEFEQAMERLSFHPGTARDTYARFPVSQVCLIADVFCYIRHDGQVQLCAWTEDRRFVLGNYLEMTQEQLSAARRGHPVCRECLRYRLNLYFHVVDCEQFNLK